MSHPDPGHDPENVYPHDGGRDTYAIGIEHHVTSLRLSRRLKELGAPQESYFWWCLGRGDQPDKTKWELNTTQDTHARDNVSAFLDSELGEMLPIGSESWTHAGGKWAARFLSSEVTYETTEPNARAKLLIHLIEQGIVDPKKLND